MTGTNARAIRWKGDDTCHRFRCCDAAVHPEGCYFIGRVRALQNFAVDRHDRARRERARAHVRTVALFAEVTDGDLQNIPEGDNGFFVNLQWPEEDTRREDAEQHMLLNTWNAIAPGHGVWMIAA